VLAQLDITKSFDVYCDTSGTGLGCVLMQEGHVIAYWVRRGGSHDWVRQTPRSFEITILESIIKHIIQTEF
jgi:hypothetical protein